MLGELHHNVHLQQIYHYNIIIDIRNIFERCIYRATTVSTSSQKFDHIWVINLRQESLDLQKYLF